MQQSIIAMFKTKRNVGKRAYNTQLKNKNGEKKYLKDLETSS